MPKRSGNNQHSSVMRRNAGAAERARAADYFPDDVNSEVDVFHMRREKQRLGEVIDEPAFDGKGAVMF
jgi:hypothetical protein